METKTSQVFLKVVVWNLQTLNIDSIEKKKKKQFLMEICVELQPDLIFLIDAGKNGKEINIPNYVVFSDGRNYLFKLAAIQDDVWQDTGNLKPTLDLNFVYVRPLESNKDIVDKVAHLLNKDFTVNGNLNLKSNQELMKIAVAKQIMGEMRLQTVIVKIIFKKYDGREF